MKRGACRQGNLPTSVQAAEISVSKSGAAEMEEALYKLHQVQLDLLRQVDRICRKYGIRYMLFAGTALGAVRHHGFIPWDDDLDVILLRPDYERFLQLAPAELDAAQYCLQAEFSAHWPMFFSKLRKNGTAFFEAYPPRDPQAHQGVYLDIFPCDNLSDLAPVRWLQFAASRVVVAKGLYQRGYAAGSWGKRLFLQLCRPLPCGPFLALCRLRSRPGSRWVHSFLGGSSRYRKSVYPRIWFTETAALPFEGALYPVSAYADQLLTRLYGDYSILPTPEQQARKRHAVWFDPEHSCPGAGPPVRIDAPQSRSIR